jgi:hypothetical protein
MTIRVIRQFTADNMKELDDHLREVVAYFNAKSECTHILMRSFTGDSNIRIIATDYDSFAAFAADMQQRETDPGKPSRSKDLHIRSLKTSIYVQLET